jgi:hypothetical protein
MVRVHAGANMLSSSSRPRILDSHSKDRGFESRWEYHTTLVIAFSYHMSLWHFQKKNHLYHSVLSNDELVPLRDELALLLGECVQLLLVRALVLLECVRQSDELALQQEIVVLALEGHDLRERVVAQVQEIKEWFI